MSINKNIKVGLTPPQIKNIYPQSQINVIQNLKIIIDREGDK